MQFPESAFFEKVQGLTRRGVHFWLYRLKQKRIKNACTCVFGKVLCLIRVSSTKDSKACWDL